VLVAGLLAACSEGGSQDVLQVRALSNRADLVSDGDALVEVVSPQGTSDLKVMVNGTDQTAAFVRRADGRMIGLVTGLNDGNNKVVASASNVASGQLTVTNAPRSGPVLSGTQTTPYYCATPTPQPAAGNTPATNGSGLSGQPDANCNIATEFTLYYRTTATAGGGAGQCSTNLPDPVWNSNGVTGVIPAQPAPPANPCWKPFTPGTMPADMATTTTINGVTVPFIVRLERGTMNRGIYDIVVLFDPTKDWTPNAPQAQWNGKIYYSFGASTGQPRRQARTTINWTTLEEPLKRGYLVAQNSMSDSSRNSNRVSMSETVMMMKEHIIDRYGLVTYTLGTGCSGGSINSNMNLSIAPGLLDGVVTLCTYPDSETTAIEVSDCTLLVEAYQKAALKTLFTNEALTQAQINTKEAAINGHPDQTGCQAWFNLFGSNGKAGLYNFRFVSDATTGAISQLPFPTNNCELPNTAVYDPANAAATANLPRCDAWSWAVSIWGHLLGGTAPLITRDNVGVQYGLKALMNGSINAEEFVTLNESVGGVDRDSTPQAARSLADETALETAYRGGIVASGKNLAKAAIIDMRGWDDSTINLPPGLPASAVFGIHHQWYSFAIRDRITRDAGDANNQALWRFADTGLFPPGTLVTDALTDMDQWLAALVTSTSNASIEAKVRATRPAATKDFCILSTDATQTTKVFDQATCDADPFLKPAASPRQVAGGPRSEDILKCQLKPLSQADYPANTFTAGQWTRLQAVFPDGVCDFGKPGVGQQAAVSPLNFATGPGGTTLPAAPTSVKQ
jgi:hypothetical protein